MCIFGKIFRRQIPTFCVYSVILAKIVGNSKKIPHKEVKILSINDGHRQRLKDRFQKEGLDHFEPHEVLELLLFYCIPRKDTKAVAKALLARFGSLNGVLSASAGDLKKVTGAGEGTAMFLNLLQHLQRYCDVSSIKEEVLLDIESCGRYMVPHFKNQKNEVVMLLCLDAKCKVLECYKVGEGSVNSAAVPIRRIVEMALGANATSVVLAHNHPSGLAFPSEEDKFTTRRLGRALWAVEIELTDHLVIADGDCVSLRQSGFYDPADCRVLI